MTSIQDALRTRFSCRRLLRQPVTRERSVDTIAQAALARYPGWLREYFQLPVSRKFVCGISFGYADVEPPVNSYRTERA